MPQIIQRLTISLKGGQTVVVPFNAERGDVLNPQIEAFFQALGDASKQGGNFLFQGSRVVLVRIADVSCADVVSLVAGEARPEEPAAPKA
ncbi:MAG: hypothetical protein HUK26_09870 [Duodenibacillus sp.]|nr:hypothetical protein [Duodenibacillus sp.]